MNSRCPPPWKLGGPLTRAADCEWITHHSEKGSYGQAEVSG